MAFDFETPYKRYPRRGEGKAIGMRRAKLRIRSQQSYEDFCRAIDNYAYLCKTLKKDRKYTLMFSTFVGRYEDYIDITEELKAKGLGGNLGLAQRILDGEFDDED